MKKVIINKEIFKIIPELNVGVLVLKNVNENKKMTEKELKEIEYSWEEKEVPGGYTMTGTTVEGLTTTITNKHTPEVIALTVTKVWDDNNDENGARPENITVTLMLNGDGIKTVELSEKNNWTYTFEDLNKYDSGDEIEYTVDENDLELYDKSITGDAENGFTITNTYNGPTGDEEEPENPVNPHTADHISTYVRMLFMSLITIINCAYLMIKKN